MWPSSVYNLFLNCLVLVLQDSQDPNPLIRALAVRTMGCIRVEKITEYLCDPLQRCLKVSLSSFILWYIPHLQEVLCN
jgi:vesicle coat complex subunit